LKRQKSWSSWNDFGSETLSGDANLTLLDLVEDRYGHRVGDHNLSNCPLNHFTAFLISRPWPRLILGQIVSQRHIKIELKGEIFKKKENNGCIILIFYNAFPAVEKSDVNW